MGTIEISVEEYRNLCMMEGKLEAVKKYCETEDYKGIDTILAILGIKEEGKEQ